MSCRMFTIVLRPSRVIAPAEGEVLAMVGGWEGGEGKVLRVIYIERCQATISEVRSSGDQFAPITAFQFIGGHPLFSYHVSFENFYR